MHPILSNQNDSELVKLLQASSVAYSKAKSGEIKITYFLLFLAVAFPVCYLYIIDENIKIALFGCTFLLTILIQIFSEKFKGNTSKGAVFKEEFDTNIFKLPWKSTIKRLDHREVLHYSRQYKGKIIRDWYSPKLSESIGHNIAVAILQHSNTSWDIELRKVYQGLLKNFLMIYSLLLFLIFVLLKVDALTIFLILFSLLSFFTHFITLIRGHSETIEKRETISKYLDERIRNKSHISKEELRDVQDEIYITRQESAKVPNLFFRWYYKQLNAETEEYIKEINDLYKS